MAREFSKRFYRSKEWKRVRDYIYKKYFGLCDDCGRPGKEVHHIVFLTPGNIEDLDISLGEKNLVLLCKECHHRRHNNINTTRDDVVFNEFGELVKRENRE